MAKVDMMMPQMGESIAEATISKWLKKPGDKVNKDEIILEISTDKVDSEIPSPSAGVIVELLYKEGDVVPVKTKIAVIDTDASASASAPAPKVAPTAKTSPAPATAMAAASAGGATGMNVVSPSPQAAPAPVQIKENGHPPSNRFYSPLVKSLAEKHGVPLTELDQIQGSGEGGRVNKHDFLEYVERRGLGGSKVAAAAVAATPAGKTRSSVPAAAPPIIDWADDDTKIVPMDKMRQAIADHMVRSKHTSPHVYSMQEVDCTNISKWRAKNKAKFQETEGFSLSFTPFFLEAAVRGLVQFPYVNCSLDGKNIILKKHVNLGCAVALGNTGLIVPVIKQAEEKNFVGLARSLNDLAKRARDKKLVPDDIAGGSFTVTNPGVFGTVIGTPIINQPQVAILCLGAIVKRPVVIDDMIAIREMCFLTLSYDHRIVDGSLGGQFLAFVRTYLENWDLERPLY